MLKAWGSLNEPSFLLRNLLLIASVSRYAFMLHCSLYFSQSLSFCQEARPWNAACAAGNEQEGRNAGRICRVWDEGSTGVIHDTSSPVILVDIM